MTSELPNLHCGKQGCMIDSPHGHGTDTSGDKPFTEHSTPACNHAHITRISADMQFVDCWECLGCGLKFTPFDADAQDALEGAERSAEAFGTALDAIAGMMSAVMFDFTERMAERYGIRPDDVRTDDRTPEQVCEDEGHDRNPDTGRCNRCGHNPFLGN